MTTKRKYSARELNEAADSYRRALYLLRALPPGEKDPEAEAVIQRAGTAVIKMVEPLLLTYFRFLSGQKDHHNKEIHKLLFLFHNDKANKPDFDTLASRVIGGVRFCLASGAQDCTEDPDQVAPYQGNDLYSWFLEIIFEDVLQKYQIMHKETGERINFFKYFSDKFRYSLASRIKRELGWEGRSVSLDAKVEDEGFSPPDVRTINLQHEVGFSDLEWAYFQGLLRPEKDKPRRRTRSKAQRVLESQIAGRLVQFRKDRPGLRSKLEIYRH
jgi:hypothetical protein